MTLLCNDLYRKSLMGPSGWKATMVSNLTSTASRLHRAKSRLAGWQCKDSGQRAGPPQISKSKVVRSQSRACMDTFHASDSQLRLQAPNRHVQANIHWRRTEPLSRIDFEAI